MVSGCSLSRVQHWDLRTLAVAAHEPKVLASTRGEARTVVIHLPAGEVMQDHQVHERAHVVVVDGEVEIMQGEQTVAGGPGLLAVFDPRERHAVRARSDARLLLVLAPWPGDGHPGTRDP
jgi:quercetin dioxygenase-like cupin family protein